MEDADFRGAYLGLADLRSPLLAHADFAGANLQGADLRGAFLAGANFAGANLRCFASHKKELHPQSRVRRPDRRQSRRRPLPRR